MLILLTYLILAPIFSAMYVGICLENNSEYKIELVSGEDMVQAFFFVALWPITIPYTAIYFFFRMYKKDVMDRASRLLNDYSIGKGGFDRSEMIEIPEGELKNLLRAFRKKWIKLNNHQVDIIRNELLNRNMERNLLK